jgi:hypothetical protein
MMTPAANVVDVPSIETFLQNATGGDVARPVLVTRNNLPPPSPTGRKVTPFLLSLNAFFQ